MKTWTTALFVLAVIGRIDAEIITFGSGDDAYEMEFVTVGDPGNVSDVPDHRGDKLGAQNALSCHKSGIE